MVHFEQLRLDHPPTGVDATRWAQGSAPKVAVGDLWLLSWDGAVKGLGLISGDAAGYVHLWPVTLESDPSFRPSFVAHQSPLAVPLVVWPTRETGVGKHLLHRNFGAMLSRRTLGALEQALETGGAPALPPVAPTLSAAEADALSEQLVETWEGNCFHEWPERRAGVPRVDPSALASAGVTVSRLADLLGVALADAVGYVRGERELDATQEVLLEQHLPPSIPVLVEDDAVRALNDPRAKERIIELARRTGSGEGAARALVRSELALAARSGSSIDGRLDYTLARLLESQR